MKNLKNLKGANELSKNEQKSINGGKRLYGMDPVQACTTDHDCRAWHCGATIHPDMHTNRHYGTAVCSVNGICVCPN